MLHLTQSIAINGFKRLASSLRLNVHLRELYLIGSGIKRDGMQVLTDSLRHNRTLSYLNLGENAMDVATVGLLVGLLKESPAINSLYLDWGVINNDVKQQIRGLLDPANREQLWLEKEGKVPERAKERVGHHAGRWTPMGSRVLTAAPLTATAALSKRAPKNSTKSHSCSHCNKLFSSKTHAAIHERIHTGEKPHGCAYCPARFSEKGNKTRHERVHTGEQPVKHVCRCCSKACRTSSKLVIHERTHTGEKPFGCTMCPKHFARKDYRKVHEDWHRGTPYRATSRSRSCKAQCIQTGAASHERQAPPRIDGSATTTSLSAP